MTPACIKIYQVVDPANLNPHFFRALLIWSLSSDVARISDEDLQLFTMDTPLVNCQI